MLEDVLLQAMQYGYVDSVIVLNFSHVVRLFGQARGTVLEGVRFVIEDIGERQRVRIGCGRKSVQNSCECVICSGQVGLYSDECKHRELWLAMSVCDFKFQLFSKWLSENSFPYIPLFCSEEPVEAEKRIPECRNEVKSVAGRSLLAPPESLVY